MRILKCRFCGGFAIDRIFGSVRTHLSKKGVDWETVVRTKVTPREYVQMIPVIDHAFYNDHGFEVVLDARGYEPPHITCTLTQKYIEISAEREIEGSSMSMSKMYSGLPKKWDSNSGDCCMSTEGIIMVSGAWL